MTYSDLMSCKLSGGDFRRPRGMNGAPDSDRASSRGNDNPPMRGLDAETIDRVAPTACGAIGHICFDALRDFRVFHERLSGVATLVRRSAADRVRDDGEEEPDDEYEEEWEEEDDDGEDEEDDDEEEVELGDEDEEEDEWDEEDEEEDDEESDEGEESDEDEDEEEDDDEDDDDDDGGEGDESDEDGE